MEFLNINYETQRTILQSFDSIAEKLAKDIQIQINKSFYRVVDFEFYGYSENFPDPYTYKHDLQLAKGRFYVHGSGVDITFGNGINYGGILLRSIIKLYDGTDQESGFMKKQYDGPHLVATELFSNLYPLDSKEKNEISILDIQGQNQDSCFYPAERTLKTKRVGLASKSTDEKDFYKNLPLRYILILPQFPKFRQTIKGIEAILGEKVMSSEITIEDAQKILGYNKIFK